MSKQELIKEIEALPQDYLKKVEEYVAELKLELESNSKGEKKPQRLRLGIGEGKGWMSPDFDEPLDEMKEYME